MGERHFLANFARGLDEIDAVIVVLLDAGGDREDVGIEDDVLGREADLFRENFVGACANFDFARLGVGLALLIKSHDHGRRAVATHDLGLGDEFFLALLQRNRIHHRLALDAFQAGLDHLELGRVHHDRDARDVGLGGDEVQKLDHHLLRIEQALVHVDVDDLGAGGDLLARHVKRGGIVAGLNEFSEFRGARDVGALADIDETNVGGQRERLQPRQFELRRDRRDFSRRDAGNALGDGGDMVRRGAAAAADDIDETAFGELADQLRHGFRALVIEAEFIGQARIGIGADARVGDARQLRDMGAHFAGAERAIEADGKRF